MNIPGTRYEGPLERKTNKWKEYHVVLSNGQLLFYKDKTSDPRDGLLGTLKLSVTTFCNSSSGVLTRGYQFSVSTPDIEAHLRSNTADQRDKWIKEIMGSVTELNEFSRMTSMRPAQMSHPEPQVYDSTLVVNMSPEHEWYWPGKTRDQAEQLLKQVDSNHFLVRDSGHEPGSYSLSVRVSNQDNMVIFHYIIKRDHAENKFILVPAPGKRFDTLEHVVAYYLHLNKDVGLQPLKNPSYKPHAAPLYGNNATLPTPSEPLAHMTYTDPAVSGMTVNPHENRRSLAPSGSSDQSTATESSEKRRSVADILDEEFSKMETGDTRANSYKYAVTQNPSSHTTEQSANASGKQTGTENEYVRLGKFPSAKQQPDNSSGYEVDGAVGNPPVKPIRPSVSRPGQSEYMNVTTQPPPQDVINSGPSNGGGNYIYAHVGLPGSGSPIELGDKIMIRGSQRSTPVVASFGDMGTPVSFSGRNGSSSLFEDPYSAPIPQQPQQHPPPPAECPYTESSYVNCELNNQVASVSISDPRGADHSEQARPKSSGMSKSSAKAGKNKQNKAKAAAASKTSQPMSQKASQPMSQGGTAPQYNSYKYPPAASGPISYNDPCLSMTQPPTPKNKTVAQMIWCSGLLAAAADIRPVMPRVITTATREEADLFPAPAGPIGYTDPALSMSTAPPSKSKQGSISSIHSQFPVAAPGQMGYTDPSIAMSKPPPKIRGSNRHNGV
ncbi:uncharacterized protein LOC134811909 isoform X2 [Bolinopsis microptera]|uniref:uncharacterized protein LOC134811909 isoform X2 n=1 Tax=Bolinopsis microptera TaxID=2820187 RepID=UPI003078CB2C